MEEKKVLITGGLGFIGSNLARRLVHDGAKVTVVDSLIPEYGGNPRNLHDIKDQVAINFSDVRDPFSMNQLVQGQDYLFNLAGQTSHLDSMENPRKSFFHGVKFTADKFINTAEKISANEQAS